MIVLLLLAGCGGAWDGEWLMSFTAVGDNGTGDRSDLASAWYTTATGTVIIEFTGSSRLSGSVVDSVVHATLEESYTSDTGGCAGGWGYSWVLDGSLSGAGVFDGTFAYSETDGDCTQEARSRYTVHGARMDGELAMHLDTPPWQTQSSYDTAYIEF